MTNTRKTAPKFRNRITGEEAGVHILGTTAKGNKIVSDPGGDWQLVGAVGVRRDRDGNFILPASR